MFSAFWLPLALLAGNVCAGLPSVDLYTSFLSGSRGDFGFFMGIIILHCQRVKKLANAPIKPTGLIKLIANYSNEGIFFMLPLFGAYVTTFRGVCYHFSGGMLPLFGGFGRAFACCGFAIIMP